MNETFGERVTKLQKDHHMTDQDLRDQIFKIGKQSISISSIRRYKEDQDRCPVWVVSAISKYFNCSTDYLLTGRDLDHEIKEAVQRALDGVFKKKGI